jgi:translation initiation factor IF-2
MPNMRVHELAKEFGMTSKELLERLHEMKIPAKNHASTLLEPYVDKIRKELGPEIEERLAKLEAERQAKDEAERKKREAEEAKKQKEEEKLRKKEEAEKKKREAEEEKKREAEEAQRKEEETARLAEEERVRAEEEKKKKEDDERRAAEQAEEERYREMAREAERAEREQRILAEAQAVASEAARKPKRTKPKAEKAPEPSVEPETEVVPAEPAEGEPSEVVTIVEGATVGEFADAVGVAPTEVIKRLMQLGELLTVNQTMDSDVIEILAENMEVQVALVAPELEVGTVFEDDPADLKGRPPVVTVMGHVDHGKTSLLDAIRETGVAEEEAGGITQHIGASVVFKNDKQITFIDTPGHEAFTAMRARGANMTDIAILVVAADDGVMPQTVEAIHHAKAAQVPIIVAVNKIDKPDADPNRVRQELTEHEIVPEDWGGDTVFVDVSAKQMQGIEDILDMILLVAEVQELKANPDAHASGVVVEAKLDRGRGPVATVLVQRGTLTVGDSVVAGTGHGRVRALIDPLGHNRDEALPADPVEILGLSSLPSAGDEFVVMPDERTARQVAEERSLKRRLLAQQKSHMSLDDLFARIQEGEVPELRLVVKADTQGSIEALKDALDKIDTSEVRITMLHSGVGAITETDVDLADASDAIVIGFNVRPEPKASQLAEKTKVDMRLYTVIYKVVEDINAARVGMLAPEYHEEQTARIEVRELFRVPKIGVIAGCYVEDGEVTRDDQVRVVRDGTIVYDGRLSSLRRFKDDVKSVRGGFECGLGIKDFQDIKVGDIVEAYRTIEVAREA